MAYINQYLLSDSRLYEDLKAQFIDLLCSNRAEIDSERVKKITYSNWQSKHYFWPDQVFHGHWENFNQRKEADGFWSLALLGQAARFHFDNDTRRLVIQSIKFDSWQSWISKQSGLPVIAYQINKIVSIGSDDYYLDNEIKRLVGFRAIVSPHHPLLEDYIDCCGLHEIHLHLNGTTLVEQLWHHALQHPDLILDRLLKESGNKKVKLLYSSNSCLNSPNDYYYLLKLSRCLREFLLTWLYEEEKIKPIRYELYEYMLKGEGFDSFKNEGVFFNRSSHWDHVSEINWQVKIQRKIKNRKKDLDSNIYDVCYLLYVLSMNCYQRLLVQGNDQYGFDQFQKFADDGGREEIETEYKSRFFQLHGPNILGNPDLATLEARFAPKKSSEKNENIVKNILRGFLEYSKGESALNEFECIEEISKSVLDVKRPKLRLVAHFIKKQPSSNDMYYYQSLREELLSMGAKLIELLNNNPNLKQIITGVDAAGNELYTPPEVFSSFYRYCKGCGIKNFTYHVGEDFEHLVTGIRSVFDAVAFLDLKNGDRIGHATAIGIDPDLWLRSMPEKIFMKRSDWLDNLLFIRKIALSSMDVDFSILKLEENILINLERLNLDMDITIAQAAFDLRYLDPLVVDSYLKDEDSGLVGWLSDELELVKVNSKIVLEFLRKRWFDEKCLSLSEELIEVDIAETSPRLITQLQQEVQRMISENHVVIETLPTSNVRISHYKTISEHHVFRWLRVGDRRVEGDSDMLIAVGSDDPGIFATDMRNEFYHIFSTLRHQFNLDPHSALNYIKTLNENGRIYHFNYDNNIIAERKKGYAVLNY